MQVCSDHLAFSSQIIMFCFNYMIQRIISADKGDKKKSAGNDSLKGIFSTFLNDSLQVFGTYAWPIAEFVLISFSRLAVHFLV